MAKQDYKLSNIRALISASSPSSSASYADKSWLAVSEEMTHKLRLNRLVSDLESAHKTFERRFSTAAEELELTLDISQPMSPEEVLEKLETIMKK